MDLQNSTIAVTGVTGFLGSHLARALLDRGAKVVGVVRTPARGRWLEDLGVRLVKADLTDPDALAAAFTGADAVVANAALSIRGRAPYRDFLTANRGGARNQARAAAKAGVGRLVHLSTIAVYRSSLNTVNAQTPMLLDGPRLSWSYLTTNWRYALSKAHGERDVWALSEELGLKTTVLRPGPIYGSRDHKLTATYAGMMARSVVPAPSFQLPHVHARDVAEAACGALSNEASAGEAYDVTGPRASVYDVLSTWTALAGAGPRLVRLPVPLWIDWDDAPARRDLGFTPRSIEAGIREVLDAA